jgi:hypothetical protein
MRYQATDDMYLVNHTRDGGYCRIVHHQSAALLNVRYPTLRSASPSPPDEAPACEKGFGSSDSGLIAPRGY